ncbi:hypothetical protein ACJX0J_030279, partial [Zea mays]
FFMQSSYECPETDSQKRLKSVIYSVLQELQNIRLIVVNNINIFSATTVFFSFPFLLVTHVFEKTGSLHILLGTKRLWSLMERRERTLMFLFYVALILIHSNVYVMYISFFSFPFLLVTHVFEKTG